MISLRRPLEFRYYSRDQHWSGNYSFVTKLSVVHPPNYDEPTQVHLEGEDESVIVDRRNFEIHFKSMAPFCRDRGRKTVDSTYLSDLSTQSPQVFRFRTEDDIGKARRPH